MSEASPKEPSNPRCRFCAESISADAVVCRYCSRHQWSRLLHLSTELAGSLGVLIALGLLVLSIVQVLETRRDRIEAAAALEKAELALSQAEKAASYSSELEQMLAEQRTMRAEINDSFIRLYGQVCGAVDGTFDPGLLACVLPDGQYLTYYPAFRARGEE